MKSINVDLPDKVAEEVSRPLEARAWQQAGLLHYGEAQANALARQLDADQHSALSLQPAGRTRLT